MPTIEAWALSNAGIAGGFYFAVVGGLLVGGLDALNQSSFEGSPYHVGPVSGFSLIPCVEGKRLDRTAFELRACQGVLTQSEKIEASPEMVSNLQTRAVLS